MNRKTNISVKQKELLLDFLERNPNLAIGKFDSKFRCSDANILWQEVEVILNAVPGARKDWRSWRKCWNDIKCAAKIKLRNQSPDEGPPIFLTALDEKLQNLLLRTSVRGDENINETKIHLYETLLGNSSEDCVSTEVQEPRISLEAPSTENEGIQSPIPNFPSFEFQETTYKTTKRRKRRIKKWNKMMNSTSAMANCMKQTNTIKESYYERKIEITRKQLEIAQKQLELAERNTIAQEKVAAALEKIANKSPTQKFI